MTPTVLRRTQRAYESWLAMTVKLQTQRHRNNLSPAGSPQRAFGLTPATQANLAARYQAVRSSANIEANPRSGNSGSEDAARANLRKSRRLDKEPLASWE